ncbi:uncharacterized protein [Arachis hypogaea]|uniref:uncharacterized protein n=1 Tax=Arachis hypogaea TaxID=3818 RepID=UPI003B21A929
MSEGQDGLWRFKNWIFVPNVGDRWQSILKEAHKSGFSVHLGITKMYQDLEAMFWWPEMKNDEALYVSKCLTCQKEKIEQQRPSGTLQPLEIPQWKWESITMNFMTGLPKTRTGCDAIWVVVDRLTKSAHFLPIQISCSMEELARMYIKEIVRLHDVPSTIISGRDSRFISRWSVRENYSDLERYAKDMCVAPAGELGPIKKIRSRMLIAQSLQKSYADQRRKPLEFEEGEHVLLKVTPTTGVGRAIKTKKLNPHYIGPFGNILFDASHVLEPESIQIREDLTLPVIPVRIDDTNIKQLHGKEVTLVKVVWSQDGINDHTWELELDMRKDYPHLFLGN